MSSIRIALLGFLLAAPLALFGCSNTTPDSGGGDGLGNFEGEIDPGSESFVFKDLETPVQDGVPIRIQLIGRFVRATNHPESVGLAVAVRNVDHRTLFALGSIVLSEFNPNTTFPTSGNPDWVRCTDSSDPTGIISECQYGYDYSDLLGGDGILSPGETSGEKFWSFHNPSGGSFSFGAQARFSLEKDPPIISGVFFSDDNRNGKRDSDEAPFYGGSVSVSGPGIDEQTVHVGENGRYSVFVREPGLYTLWAFPPPTFGFAPLEFTTPNPLEVVILPAQSFFHADFGLANAFEYPPVRFAESEDSLRTDAYTLLGADLDGRIFRLKVGFSGCSPDHPFQLYWVGGIMESFPPQARIVLSHSDRGELCDAYWMRELGYNMTPLLRESGADRLILRFVDWHGNTHTFELQ